MLVLYVPLLTLASIASHPDSMLDHLSSERTGT